MKRPGRSGFTFFQGLWIGALVMLAACSLAIQPPQPTFTPRTETLEVPHSLGGQTYTVTFLPDANGHTFITADGDVFMAQRPMTARVAVSGGGLTRKDYFPALRILEDVCRGRTEFVCRAYARDNGGPIFVEGRWLFQFTRSGEAA